MTGSVIGKKFQKAMYKETDDLNKDANLLCSDVIINFKTCQSYGYEDAIIKKYRFYLDKSHDLAICENLKAGIALGMSQFVIYTCFAALFYFGGVII